LLKNYVSTLTGELADLAQGRVERAAAYKNKKLIASAANASILPHYQCLCSWSWMRMRTCQCNIQTIL